MDVFDFDNNLMKVIKKLFRIVEILVALIILSWVATRLPSAVKISGEYSRRLAAVVVSHLFVFLLSNAIVLTLFFNFRNLFPRQNASEPHLEHFCQEFIENSGGGAIFGRESPGESEEIVCVDKKTVFEVTRAKVPRRSLSGKSLAEDYKQLRRSETEIRRRMKAAAAAAEVVDELSNEDFQRTVDAFIAKQMKFRQEEKLDIVLHGCS